MDKKVYYINMHNNINKLAAYNINIEGDYLCPLCLKAYKEQDVRNVLTEEDVPQHSLGGKRIVLTCKNIVLMHCSCIFFSQTRKRNHCWLMEKSYSGGEKP